MTETEQEQCSECLYIHPAPYRRADGTWVSARPAENEE